MTAQESWDEKQCTKCGEWWFADREFFYTDKRSADGLRTHCKACEREYHNERDRRLKEWSAA